MLNDLYTGTDVRVRNSSTGLGVFAAREFVEHEIIGIATGRIVVDSEYASEYCIEMDDTISLEPGPPFRFLNHCCDPNAELVSDDIGADGSIPDLYVTALQRIAVDEEILIDYAWPYDYAVPCECKSPNCRGWIVAEEERHLIDI